MTITISVPGKLFIAGEYAITTSYAKSVISPVNRYLSATIQSANTIRVTSTQNADVTMTITRQNNTLIADEPHYPIILSALQVSEQFLNECGYTLDKQYHIHITSQLDMADKKLGLGSSGAVTVAVIRCILDFFGYVYHPMLIYKLGVLAHLQIGSLGSFGDIATSAFHQLIAYTLFDKEWLDKQTLEVPLHQLVLSEWKGLEIMPLTLPKNTYFLAGWTGSPASTEQLVAQITHKKQSDDFHTFITKSNTCITKLITAIQDQNCEEIHQALTQNRLLLNQLAPEIETPSLTNLCNLAQQFGCGSKTSGAGGGDCGICFISQPEKQALIETEWAKQQIISLGAIQC